MEGLQGRGTLIGLELFSSLVPLRTWRELIDLRNAIRDERLLKGRSKRVTSDMIHRDFAAFIKDQDRAIGHASSAMNRLLRVLHNVALDVHDMKNAIKLMLEEDIVMGKGGSKLVKRERDQMLRLQANVNSKLRDMSDTLGALTRE